MGAEIDGVTAESASVRAESASAGVESASSSDEADSASAPREFDAVWKGWDKEVFSSTGRKAPRRRGFFFFYSISSEYQTGRLTRPTFSGCFGG